MKNDDGSNKTAVNVPGITLPDGRRLNRTVAAEKFGFFAIKIWKNESKFNCKRMEELVQKEFEHLPFGEILWRTTGAGKEYKDVFSQHCCVYLLHIENGTLIYGNREKTLMWDAAHPIKKRTKSAED
ncbi:MAG: hypothetical protein SGARI_005860 [Bacillariaceae sp.]